MYKDETGYVKGEVQRRKIVETEIFSVDERISIISELSQLLKKRKGRVRDKQNNHLLSCQIKISKEGQNPPSFSGKRGTAGHTRNNDQNTPFPSSPFYSCSCNFQRNYHRYGSAG